MEYSTAIITFIPARSKPEFVFRMLKNVDEQSYTNYHHFLFCEDEATQKSTKSLFSLLSSNYENKATLLFYDNYLKTITEIENTGDYITIHPVEDTWSPLFLEKMIMELTSCAVDICGVWSRYNLANEVVRGKVISVDKITAGPEYAGLILPSYNTFKQAAYIQGLYYVEDVSATMKQLSPGLHEMAFAVSVGYALQKDILGITETLATVHNRRVTPVDIREQQARNWVYRQYPMLLMMDAYES